jgi:hypothetical protein
MTCTSLFRHIVCRYVLVFNRTPLLLDCAPCLLPTPTLSHPLPTKKLYVMETASALNKRSKMSMKRMKRMKKMKRMKMMKRMKRMKKMKRMKRMKMMDEINATSERMLTRF